jgi:molecular chaperone DnaK (HSP70)
MIETAIQTPSTPLDEVLFVVVSKRIPLVWQMVAEHTGMKPMVEINPDETVALGAGVQAGILASERIDTMSIARRPCARAGRRSSPRCSRVRPLST